MGGVFRQWTSKRVYSLDDALAELGKLGLLGGCSGAMEMGTYLGVTEVDAPAYDPVEMSPLQNPPTGSIELPTSGWTEI